MNNDIEYEEISPYVFVTKLAGFEHSEYIQPNATKIPMNTKDIPMVQGKNIRGGEFVEKYDWYIKKEISDSLPRSILNKRCILIPYVGSNLGEVGIFPNKYVCHLASNIAKVELNSDKYLLEYMKYYMQSPIGQSYLFQAKQGSSQPNITMESIRKTKIIKKSINEQIKIVSILSSIDAQIKRNNDMVQKLQVLTHSAFDYFSKHNNYENKIALNDIIVEKNKSQIQVNNIIDGSGDIPFFTSGESILYTDNSLTNGFNIFLSTGGNAKVQSYYGNVSYSTDTWCITSKNNLQYYLYGYLKHIENQMDKLYFHGTGLKHLQKPLFLKSIIEIPNNSVIQKFNLIVEPMYIQISKLTQSNVKLQRLKNKLLPLLINQQLL